MARRRRWRGPRRPQPAPGAPESPALAPPDAPSSAVPAVGRVARIERKTRETEILLQLNVDGTGEASAQTTIPFLNHMLEAMGKHGLLDLKVDARGDTEVDLHHTVEDVGIVLGQ